MGDGRLRVLLVAQPTSGGTRRCVAQLAQAAAAAGLDATVVCPREGPLVDDVRDAGARWIEMGLRRQPDPRDVAHVVALRRHFGAADVVHLHSSKAGAVGRLALRSLGRNRPGCAFTPHGWSWQSGGPLTGAYRAFERRTASWVDAIISVSPEERDAGRAVMGDVPIEVIENGVDVEHFTPDGDLAPRAQEPLLVCVGRLASPKGQDVAVRALAAMQHRDARLRLVGDGPDRPALAELARELGVAERVELIGEVGDAAPHLRAADIVVVPSYSEGQSLAMLEAMACARPVVTTAVAGTSAVKGCGVVVPIGDPPSMAAALDELLATPTTRAQLGEDARRRACASHDVRIGTSRHVALWRQLAENGRTPAAC
jgi:glycosyltransferase involved in cell wall biosynthesis